MKRASGDLLEGSYLCIEIYIKIDYNTHLHIYIYLKVEKLKRMDNVSQRKLKKKQQRESEYRRRHLCRRWRCQTLVNDTHMT